MLAVACSSPEGSAPTPEADPPATRSSTPVPTPERVATVTEAPDQATLDRRLIDAAWKDDLPRARRLVALGADVNAKDDTEQSAYLIATSEGHLRLLDLTLRHGADVGSLDSFHGTGLIRAADRGHAAVAGRLVREGVAVDHVNELGWTALHEAIILGDGSRRYVDTVRVLVAAGADLRLPSRGDGVTPLQHAESKGYADLTTTLRAGLRDVRMSQRDADRRLLAASARGDADAVAVALRAGARTETRDEHQRTPLLLASANDRVAVARLLVHLGADPDALDDRHDTPWLVTGVTGSVPMLETLLPARPDLRIRNRFGGVSVIPASERGHVDYVRRVVRTGIDVNHVNDLGWTALLEAVILGDGSRDYQEIVRTLLAAGADPGIGDHDGVTPLEHARRQGQTAVTAILERAT
ncbi:MAG: ankyrin repeat domain-containing protein [Nocardioidaceae bacterium]|nr:ankyrin repeat domain-containing protein [Nocardioidaceae bacterium]